MQKKFHDSGAGKRVFVAPTEDDAQAIQSLKRLIWLYFWLWIFEGALRKWVVPSLANHC